MSASARAYSEGLSQMLDRRAKICEPCKFKSRDECPGWYWPDIPCPKGLKEPEIVPSISRGERHYEEKTEKFPEEETADGGRFGDYDVYDRVEVDDWFKRCLSEYPRGAYKDIDHERIDWFNKWFSQFKKEEEPEEAS